MSTKFPPDVLAQAQTVLAGWNQLAPTPTFGPLTITALSTDLNTMTALDAQIAGLEAQLAARYNERETAAINLWDKVKRVRSSMKGVFGDDSTQYEMVGGIRMSERKFRTRKRATTE